MRNKNKLINWILVLGLGTSLLTGPLSVLAQDAADQRSEDRAQRADKVRTQRLANLKRLMGVHIGRISSAIEKLGNLIERIERRMEIMHNQGMDISGLAPLVDRAQDQKQTAEQMLAEARSKYAAIENSDNPRQAATEFIASVRQLKQQLISLHNTLKQIVREMKNIINTQREDSE